MESIPRAKVMYTAVAVSEKQASRREKRDKSRNLYDEDGGTEDVEELAGFNPREELWKGVIFFSSLATIGTNIFAMVAFGGPIHEAAAIVATLVATTATYREFTMDSINTVRKTLNIIKADLNELVHENIRHSEEVGIFQHQVFCLKEAESRLKDLSVQESNVQNLIRLVKKEAIIRTEIQKLLFQDVIADVVAVVFEADKDGSGIFTEKKTKRMIHRLKNISGITVNEKRLRAALGKNNSVLSVLDLVIDLSHGDISSDDRIFDFDWDDPVLQVFFGENAISGFKTVQEKIEDRKRILDAIAPQTKDIFGEVPMALYKTVRKKVKHRPIDLEEKAARTKDALLEKPKVVFIEKPKAFHNTLQESYKNAQERMKNEKVTSDDFEVDEEFNQKADFDSDDYKIEATSTIQHKLLSPLYRYPDNNGVNCWSVPSDDGMFKVRGQDYFKNRKKVPSGPASFNCRGVDMWLTNNPVYHIARHPNILGGKFHDDEGYATFLVNFQLPLGSLVCYFRVPPVEEMTDKMAMAWTKFVQGDDKYRNARLKVVQNVIEGGGFLRTILGDGKHATVLGKNLSMRYFFQDRARETRSSGDGGDGISSSSSKSGVYYEVDVNIRDSIVIKRLTNSMKKRSKDMTMAVAFIIQANEEEELPETVLCSFQIHSLNLEFYSHLPEYNLDDLRDISSIGGVSKPDKGADQKTDLDIADEQCVSQAGGDSFSNAYDKRIDATSQQRLLSPLHRYPDNNGIACWSIPSDDGIFKVRGQDYFKNRKKVPSGPSNFTCRGVDMWLTDKPVYHIARHPNILGGKLHDNEGFDTFLVNFQLPLGSLVGYFRIPPIEEMPDKVAIAWTKFVQGDDKYRNARLKVLPNAVEGPKILRKIIGNGTRPIVPGNRVSIRYFFQDRVMETRSNSDGGGSGDNIRSSGSSKSGVYYEVDISLRESNMARRVLKSLKKRSKGLVLAVAIIIQANEDEELPETVLSSFQVHSLNAGTYSHLPEYYLDDAPADSGGVSKLGKGVDQKTGLDIADEQSVSEASEDCNSSIGDDQSADSSSHRLISPLYRYPDNNGVNCWSIPSDHGIFKVRGQDYFKNRKKAPSGPSPLTCRGVDMWLTDKPVYHIARHPNILGGEFRDNEGFDTFLVNFLLPFGNFVCYFRIPPIEEMSDKMAMAWTKFVQGDDKYRNARLKVLPNVVEGAEILRKIIGDGAHPTVLGNGLSLSYFFQDGTRESRNSSDGSGYRDFYGDDINISSKGASNVYYEVDVNMSDSYVARKVLDILQNHAVSMTLAIAFIIQSNEKEGLPETILCSFQIHSLDFGGCSRLPEYNFDVHNE